MGKILNKIFGKKAGKETADPLHSMLDRPSDPMLTAIQIRNDSGCVMIFDSILEEKSDLVEPKAWRKVFLQKDETKVFPHQYFTATTEDRRDCKYTASPAPKGSDFIYSRKMPGTPQN